MRLMLTVCCVLVCGLVFASTPASTGAYIGQITEAGSVAFGSLGSAVVDARGELWICEAAGLNHVRVHTFSNGQTNAFLATKEAVVSGSSSSPLCAVDSKDDLYIGDGGSISKFNSAGQILIPKLDEEPVSGIAIEFASNDVYVDEISRVNRFTPEGMVIEGLDVPGMHGSGVAVNSATGTLYVADSSSDMVDVFGPEQEKTKEEEKEKKWLKEFNEEGAKRLTEEATARNAAKKVEEAAAVAATKKHEEATWLPYHPYGC